MKKQLITTSLLFLMMIGLRAQITISSGDMPVAGDTIRSSVSFDFMGYDFSETGTDFFWDFTGLIPFNQRVDTFITVKQTPILFWPFFLGSSNLVLKLNDFAAIPVLPAATGFNFLNRTSSLFSDVGIGLVVEGLPLPLKYDTPDVLYRFPLNYGDTDSGSTGLEFSLPDVGYLYVERDRFTEVDGWGTVATPFGSFDVLRLKSIVNEFDSIYIDSLGMGFPIVRDYIEYKWLAKNMGTPILTVIEDMVFGSTIIYQDSVRNINVSVPELIARQSDGLKLYPNPARHELFVECSITTNEPLAIRITDMSGRLVYVGLLPAGYGPGKGHRILLDPNVFRPGVYVLYLGKNEHFKSVRFIIEY